MTLAEKPQGVGVDDPLPAGERMVRELRKQFANRVRGLTSKAKPPHPRRRCIRIGMATSPQRGEVRRVWLLSKGDFRLMTVTK